MGRDEKAPDLHWTGSPSPFTAEDTMTEKKNSAATAAAKSTKEEQENTDRVQKPEEAEAYIASKKATADARGHETQSAGTQMNSPQNTDDGASQFGPDVVIDGDKDEARD